MDNKTNVDVRRDIKVETRRVPNPNNQIDLVKLAGVLWSKKWILIITGIVFAVAAFFYTKILVTPMYSTSAMLYVNNNDISVGETKLSISSADVYASNSLVDNFIVIMKTRTTMEEVLERSGLNYTPAMLSSMVSASSVNDTSVLAVKVTGPVPEDNQIIANTLMDVLPDRITSIIKGCSVRLVEKAVVSKTPISPNTMKNMMTAGMMGVLLMAAFFIVIYLLDDVIHDEDEVKKYYSGIPMLGAIPDTNSKRGNGHTYGKKVGHKER